LKIIDVKTKIYKWDLPQPITNGLHTYTSVSLNIIEVHTDEGIKGIGLSAGIKDGEKIVKEIVEYFKPKLIGLNPLDNEMIWKLLWEPKIVGRRGITTRVISGIDLALLDFKSKLAQMPAYKLLGGYTNKVRAYIAGGYYEDGKGEKELAEEMEDNLNLGATAVKMKIGGVSVDDDIKRIQTVRNAVGSNVDIMVDANCAYNLNDAIKIADKMEKYDIFWFEEPLLPDDYNGYQILSSKSAVPIATGENEYTKYGFNQLIEKKGATIIQPDALVLGGSTEFMKIASLADINHLSIAPHGNQNVHVQLLCAIPNGLILEYYVSTTDPLWGQIYEYDLSLKNGMVSPPDVPGLGLEIKEKNLEKYRVV
tara:strand:+ start:1253 stop:2350 length:1098 start_codon:yes stop_codon:yes gene_type:complete